MPRQQDFATARKPRDTGGEVDCRSEVVAVALDGGPVMEPHADGRSPVPRQQPAGQVEAEQDCLAWVRNAQHEGVADRLHMRGAGG
jgi:hypothetical protein